MVEKNLCDIPVTAIKGVGPRKAALLEQVGIKTIADLYDFFPRRYLDRRTIKHIDALVEGELVTVVGTVKRVMKQNGRYGRSRLNVTLLDKSGALELVWFRGVSYVSRTLREGDVLAVHGKVGVFGRQRQMQHPEFERLNRDQDSASDEENNVVDLFHTGKIVPVYPSSEPLKQAGLGSRGLRGVLQKAFVVKPPFFRENLPDRIVTQYGLLPLNEAYRMIHFPSSPEMLDRALYRFKWTELFYAQLVFAIRRAFVHTGGGAIRFERSGNYTAKLYDMLPYSMTTAQKNAVREIYRDLRSGNRMNRLLQGDVGSGKTLVAMFAMTLAADNGLQAAFMAPTEILAFQHFMVMKELAESLGLHVGFLGGRQRIKERRGILDRLEAGLLHILVGTHAVIEDTVRFKKLGLAVIDEQHRFGVLQRKALQDKAENPHVLLMTATPIPRTLTMGVFGDLDVTVIDQLPGGRKHIVTRLCRESEKPEVLRFLRREVEKGRQAYIVYPLVEESEKIDLKAAAESFRQLRDELPPGISMGLIHGQMPSDEKERVMGEFRSGQLDLLVGTTVIEVGVDVPNATIMVVEHAERFGLAQLHQLRGRVGRGQHQSYCFLLYAVLGDDARERLSAMESTTDGFRLSEIDAALRGTGNILGKEQSGVTAGLKIADISRDYDIMCSARKAAFELVRGDMYLRDPANEMIRNHYREHYHERFLLVDIG
ncbi:MAG: ATP-dependent DNA helicase RecG [Chlorobiales bacterium]|nr:ATP-dependent DNA helicase RecG [Chlorobiales bacterium]